MTGAPNVKLQSSIQHDGSHPVRVYPCRHLQEDKLLQEEVRAGLVTVVIFADAVPLQLLKAEGPQSLSRYLLGGFKPWLVLGSSEDCLVVIISVSSMAMLVSLGLHELCISRWRVSSES